MKNKNILILILVFLISLSSFAFAEDKVKVGPNLMESKPASNETDVKIDTEIFLLFNKNVVNGAVRENNRESLKLYNSKGKEVAIEVIFPDDQLEPHKRRELHIKPLKPLEKSETYKVVVLTSFMSKNGENVESQMSLTFETEKESATNEKNEDKAETNSKEKTDSIKEKPVIEEVNKEESIDNKETNSDKEVSPVTKDDTELKAEDTESEEDISVTANTIETKEEVDSEDTPNGENGKEQDNGRSINYKMFLIAFLVAGILLYIIMRKNNEKK